jgi:hypothetical protein
LDNIYQREGALHPFPYTTKKDYSGEILSCNKLFISAFFPNYNDPPYIYAYGLNLIEGKWLQQNETRSQMHGSTTNTNLIKEIEVN